MSAPTTSTAAGALEPAERLLRERVLKAILCISIVDLLLLLPLIYGLVAGVDSLSPIFGPLHGTGFLIELGLIGWGAINGWWGWWYPAVTLITTGPPGAILGHPKAKREALGA